MRDTSYATELATAEVNYCRIERLHVKEEGQDEIHFSWWPDGKVLYDMRKTSAKAQ